MAADLVYKKKYIKYIVNCILAAVFSFVGIYAILLSKAEKIDTDKSFFFLVDTSMHLEASAQLTVWRGGAGYLLQASDKEYVAYCVYFDREYAEKVQQEVPDSLLLEITAPAVFLKNRKDKANALLYREGLSNLYLYAECLNAGITSLEKGQTQESIKKYLKTLSGHCFRLFSLYKEGFSECARIFQEQAKQLSNAISDTVYLNNLRYILCQCIDGYLCIADKFAM